MKELGGSSLTLAAFIALIALAFSSQLSTAAPPGAGTKSGGSRKETNPDAAPITLYGQIDELSYICSSAGVQLTSGKMPAKITKIALGSAAAYSGLRPGDTVLDLQLEENTVLFSIDRNGKKYQARVATDVKGLKAEFKARKVPYSFGDSAFDKELRNLNGCQLFVLLDRCQTMADAHAGCPGDMTKWMWCKQQLDNLYIATNRVIDGGFNLVLFNDTYQIKKDVTLWDLKQVFDQMKPTGERKNLSKPIDDVLTDYFKARKPNSKPCVLIVITDGVRNIGEPLQNVLIAQSQNMTRPGEVVVTFLQIGDSISAEELLDDLDRHLVAKGAKYHLVNYKPFTEVRNKGVLWEVCTAAQEAIKANPKPLAQPQE